MKKRYLLLCLLACCGLLALAGCGISPGSTSAKPVIYLYPEEETTVSVQLDYTGQLTTTYPAYGDGWTVTAHPDGTLTDPTTGGPARGPDPGHGGDRAAAQRHRRAL